MTSLLRHRDGLTVFVDNAAVDNNPAERDLAISRKLSFGSHSVDGARLAGMSVFGTLAGVSPYRWLLGYACARRPPPEGPAAWLPWGAGERKKIARRRLASDVECTPESKRGGREQLARRPVR